MEEATAPITGPTVLSGFRTTETTVKVSTWKIRVSVVPAFSRERESNQDLLGSSPTRYRWASVL